MEEGRPGPLTSAPGLPFRRGCAARRILRCECPQVGFFVSRDGPGKGGDLALGIKEGAFVFLRVSFLFSRFLPLIDSIQTFLEVPSQPLACCVAGLREGAWGPHPHLLVGARFLSTVKPEKGVNHPHIQELGSWALSTSRGCGLGSCAKGPEKCMLWLPSISPKAPPRPRTFPPSRRFHPLFQVLFLFPMDQSELSKFQTLTQLGGFRECLCGLCLV